MKVLVVNPPNKPFTERSLLIEPIDILGVATYIKSLGHEALITDMNVKQLPAASIESIVEAFQPDLTIVPFDYHVPLHTSDAIPGVEKIAQISRKHGSKTAIAGKTSKEYPNPFLTNGFDITINMHMEPVLDYLLRLEDWSTEELATVPGISFSDNGRVRTTLGHNSIDLNTLPIPDRTMLNLSDYIDVRGLLSSRGCSNLCNFCPSPTFWGPWKGRNAKSVVDEIEMLVSEHKAKKIMFLDDNATADHLRMREISDMILERGISSTYGCLGTVGLGYVPETLELMHKAGFRWIHYGAESGSDKVLAKVCRYKNKEAIRRAINTSKAIGLRVRTSWIYDLPGTDKEAVQETNALILETEPQEIRIHYMVQRAGTCFHAEQKDDTIPSQYIHQDEPQGTTGCDMMVIAAGINGLVHELRDRGYLVVKDASDWDKISQLENPRFISFCPSRYGLGWGD